MTQNDLTPSQVAFLIQKYLKSKGHQVQLGTVQEALCRAIGNGADMNQFTSRFSFKNQNNPRAQAHDGKCKNCDSDLIGYYCSQDSCYYADWPQHIPMWKEHPLSPRDEAIHTILYETSKRDRRVKEVYSVNGTPTMLAFRRKLDDVLLLTRKATDLRDQLFRKFTQEIDASQVLGGYVQRHANDQGVPPSPLFFTPTGVNPIVYIKELSSGYYSCVWIALVDGAWRFIFAARKPCAPKPKPTKRRISSLACELINNRWIEIHEARHGLSTETLRDLLAHFVEEGERLTEDWIAAAKIADQQAL